MIMLSLALAGALAAPVAATPPAGAERVGGSNWTRVFIRVVKEGTFKPKMDMFPESIGLERVTGPVRTARKADYATLWGQRDQTGLFAPWFATFVSEDWTMAGQDEHADQWLIRMELDGSVASVTHRRLIRHPDGSAQLDGLDESGAAVQAKLEELLRFWLN